MKPGLFIALVLFSSGVFGQAAVGAIGDLWLVNQGDRQFKLHPAIQPMIRLADSTAAGKDLLKATAKEGNYFRLNLFPDSYFAYDDSSFYRAAAGFSLETQLNKKFYARAGISAGYATADHPLQSHSFVTYDPLKRESMYADVRARFSYTFNKVLQVAAGIDNQFFGEGARSLVQGDHTAPNPFAMLRANFWRLEYGLLYQTFREYAPFRDDWKYSVTHYLSMNVTKNWNVTLLENVVFQSRDTIYRRGFELEYLNPIVFFRPQEYSIGSADNALIAAHTSVTFRRQTVYMQAALDDFDINEIRSRSRWWANKFAVQLGVKGMLNARLRYRVEGNLIRPFTYSHINQGLNVGNAGRPLAHPDGANLAELLAEVQLLKEKWNVKSYAVFLLKGYDSDSLSNGGDVYRNYTIRAKDYGYVIGGGKTVRQITAGAELSYLLPKLSSRVYVDPQYRFIWGDGGKRSVISVSAGIRSELFGKRRRF